MLDALSPLCTVWSSQVKELFANLHGHQSKTLAAFVWGAIRAKSIVVQQVAEELRMESHAKCESIEKRLRRFLANERVEVSESWDSLLAKVLPYWKGKKVSLILDLTPFDEHATVIYVGLIQKTRVLPLAWKVMPGQVAWGQGLWEIVQELFEQVGKYLESPDCTLIADRGLGYLTVIRLCQAQGWHYLLRISKDTQVRRRYRGFYGRWNPVSEMVNQVGQRWSGTVDMWQEHEYEVQLSAVFLRRKQGSLVPDF